MNLDYIMVCAAKIGFIFVMFLLITAVISAVIFLVRSCISDIKASRKMKIETETNK